MTNEQTQHIHSCIRAAQDRLQEVETGQDSCANSLAARREMVDWEVCWLLVQLIPALPSELQAKVQACSDARERVWSEAYHQEYYSHKKTSSESLATAS